MNNKVQLMGFYIEPKRKHEIKILAARRNISVSWWICEAIDKKMLEEKKYDKNDELSDMQ